MGPNAFGVPRPPFANVSPKSDKLAKNLVPNSIALVFVITFEVSEGQPARFKQHPIWHTSESQVRFQILVLAGMSQKNATPVQIAEKVPNLVASNHGSSYIRAIRWS